MNCERCQPFCRKIAEYRVRTDIMNLKVCRQCSDEARAIGLKATPLRRDAGANEEESPSRGGADSLRGGKEYAV